MNVPGDVSRSARIVLHEHSGEQAWIAASVTAIGDALRTALAAADTAHLLLSGGTTPAPVYHALAETELDWSRVAVGLVDERDVEPDADGSNARLIGETLLRASALAARFEPLRGGEQSAAAAAAAANARWKIARPAPVVVLGMGDDGHTASLFPGAANLDAVLTVPEPYAVVEASGCAGAGVWPRRISLTPMGFAAARARILLIRGTRKREVFENALTPGDVRRWPIRVAIDAPGARLQVEWCA